MVNDATHDDEFKGFDTLPHALTIKGQIVYTSAPMDTLDYLFRHLRRHLLRGTANKPVQLKWVADIVSLVERHAETMNWEHLRQHDKSLLEGLDVFYSLTQMPERYAKIIPVRRSPAPSGLNQYPNGWPQQMVQEWKHVGLLRFLWLTFSPPSIWWLRLYYGINERSCFWYGQIFHRMRILRLMLWTIIRRIQAIVSRRNIS